MKRVCFSSRQRHLAALCQSHSGQISSAAGWHTLHHHRWLSSHCGQVCVVFVFVLWQQRKLLFFFFRNRKPSRNEHILLQKQKWWHCSVKNSLTLPGLNQEINPLERLETVCHCEKREKDASAGQKWSRKLTNHLGFFFPHREKDMDHAIRIPEMGVSKVIVSTSSCGYPGNDVCLQMMWPF